MHRADQYLTLSSTTKYDTLASKNKTYDKQSTALFLGDMGCIGLTVTMAMLE